MSISSFLLILSAGFACSGCFFYPVRTADWFQFLNGRFIFHQQQAIQTLYYNK